MSDIPNPSDPAYGQTSEMLRRNGDLQKKESKPESVVRLYVCACGNYYGSSSMGKLQDKPNIAPTGSTDAGKIRSYRSRCPDCGLERVERYARLIPKSDVAEVKRALTR